MKKNIRRVFWLYFILFAALVVYFGKFMIRDRAAVINSSLNPRMNITDAEVARGSIFDSEGRPLAASSGAKREYPYGRAFAHVVGYADKTAGLSGVEQKYNLSLQSVHLELVQRLANFITASPIRGNDIYLTLNAELQELAYGLLEGHKGAVIIAEPSTGKILAMVSRPDFDPNTVGGEWAALRADNENSPLLNRASQGKYPPGSVFKVLTAAAALESLHDIAEYRYECAGSEDFNGEANRIRCFNSTEHGTVDIHRAFALSCNTFFANVGFGMGPTALADQADRLYFNRQIPFALEAGASSFPLTEGAGASEIIETSIGQGRTMATPLHMALITSAIANGGIMMKPYVADRVVAYNGSVTDKTLPVAVDRVFEPETAVLLKNMMAETMEYGTGVDAKPDGFTSAGKTGSAQNPIGEDHGWFIGFAPAEEPAVTVCVVLENCGGSRKTLPIAKKLLEVGARIYE